MWFDDHCCARECRDIDDPDNGCWEAGARVQLVPGSRPRDGGGSNSSGAEHTGCATLDGRICSGSGQRSVDFDNGGWGSWTYAYEDLEPCSEVWNVVEDIYCHEARASNDDVEWFESVEECKVACGRNPACVACVDNCVRGGVALVTHCFELGSACHSTVHYAPGVEREFCSRNPIFTVYFVLAVICCGFCVTSPCSTKRNNRRFEATTTSTSVTNPEGQRRVGYTAVSETIAETAACETLEKTTSKQAVKAVSWENPTAVVVNFEDEEREGSPATKNKKATHVV